MGPDSAQIVQEGLKRMEVGNVNGHRLAAAVLAPTLQKSR